MGKGIKRAIRTAISNVDAEIRDNARSGSRFASGIAAEGYAGGFRDALHAVLAVLDGHEPSNDRARQYFGAPPPAPDHEIPFKPIPELGVWSEEDLDLDGIEL